MERADLDADIIAADQELSALLEKHINAPMKKSIEQVSGGLSLTLKGDFEANILSLRSELKKLGGAFEDLNEDLGRIRHGSSRIETLVQQAEGMQDDRHEKLAAFLAEIERRVTDGMTGVEERLGKLGNAHSHHLNSMIKGLTSDLQSQQVENHEAQNRMLEKLDKVALLTAAHIEQEENRQRVSKGRFVWLLAGLLINAGALAALLIKSFLTASA